MKKTTKIIRTKNKIQKNSNKLFFLNLIKTITRFFFIFFILLYNTSINTNTNLHKVILNKNIRETKKTNEHVFTIFIHGTLLPFPSFEALKQTMQGKRKTKIHHSNTKLNNKKRKKLSFIQKYLINLKTLPPYKYQIISNNGLINLNNINKVNPTAQKILSSYKLAIKNCEKNLSTKKENINKTFSFYSFGWEGSLSQRVRYKYSLKLYKQLYNEIQKIKKSINPNKISINILAHSHGGNVALNLAKAEDKYKKNLTIDNLILMATPIQSETSNLIHSSIFKKINNIYSRGDPIQIIDIISTKDSISKRRFRERNKNSKLKQENTLEFLPKKLTQIEIRFGQKKPLHNEFWFWGEKYNFMYRKKIPIFPIPLLSLTPIITKYVEKNLKNAQNIIINIEKNNENLNFCFKNTSFPNQKHFYDAHIPINKVL